MSAPLWTIDAMTEAMGAELRGTAPDVTGISIDSRTVAPGEAYFAIKGDVHDGHKFVAAAAANGAAVSVVGRGKLDSLDGEIGALLVVDDVLAALEKLGIAARARSGAKIVAVTGSVGKTTTKEALREAFAASGTVHASVASFNNHWGVPLTLARMPEDTATGIFEIGMNHPNEISPLVKMVRPHVAIITNVAAVHLGAFRDVDGIAAAKAEIFDGLEADGVGVLNADDPRFGLLSEMARNKGVGRIVSFGEANEADVRISRLVEHASCSCLTADVLGTEMTLKVGIPGRHIVQNVMAVLAAVSLTGADLAKAGLALAELGAVKGRGVRHKITRRGGNALLIDESYNANPTSQRAALAMLGRAEPQGGHGRRIAVLGDMGELGPTSAELHAGLADAVVANASVAYLAGPDMAHLAKALRGLMPVHHFSDVKMLTEALDAELRAGDVMMAKASLSQGFGAIVDYFVDSGTADGETNETRSAGA